MTRSSGGSSRDQPLGAEEAERYGREREGLDRAVAIIVNLAATRPADRRHRQLVALARQAYDLGHTGPLGPVGEGRT